MELALSMVLFVGMVAAWCVLPNGPVAADGAAHGQHTPVTVRPQEA